MVYIVGVSNYSAAVCLIILNCHYCSYYYGLVNFLVLL